MLDLMDYFDRFNKLGSRSSKRTSIYISSNMNIMSINDPIGPYWGQSTISIDFNLFGSQNIELQTYIS